MEDKLNNSGVGGSVVNLVEKDKKSDKKSDKKTKKLDKQIKREELSQQQQLINALKSVKKTEDDIFVDQDGKKAITYNNNCVSITTIDGKHLYLSLEMGVEVTRRAVYPNSKK